MWIYGLHEKKTLYEKLKPRLNSLDDYKKKLDELKKELDSKQNSLNQYEKKIEYREMAVETIAKEKAIGFPWLADAYAEFFALEAEKDAQILVYKRRPAVKAADVVKEYSYKRIRAEKLFRVFKYQVEMYESLFPWLADFKDQEIDDEYLRIRPEDESTSENQDPAEKWLSKEEYHQLSSSRKYQLALDRYFQNRKSKWEIGRDYERFVGYQFEKDGFEVRYQGILAGFEDLGRDLICTRGNDILIVQCKCWSKQKVIHEKHIFQLLGTMMASQLENPDRIVTGNFVTSTQLSDTAKKYAKILKIAHVENFTFKKYPVIKCNVSSLNGEKIYHLPFDQQYDRTFIKEKDGDMYAESIEEAERAGFRRAKRYRYES